MWSTRVSTRSSRLLVSSIRFPKSVRVSFTRWFVSSIRLFVSFNRTFMFRNPKPIIIPRIPVIPTALPMIAVTIAIVLAGSLIRSYLNIGLVPAAAPRIVLSAEGC